MRSSIHGPEQFLLISKKPRIRELVTRASSMTLDEIKSLSEKPDTIRGLIILHERKQNISKQSHAEYLADLMIAANPVRYGLYPACEIYRLDTVIDNYVRWDSNSLEIKSGYYYGITDKKYIIKYIEIPPQPQWLPYSTYIRSGTVKDLKDLEYEFQQSL